MKANEIRDKLASLYTRQEEILAREHEDDDPALTGEESQEFDTIEGEVRKFEDLLQKAETSEARVAKLADYRQEVVKPSAAESEVSEDREAAHAQAYTNYLRFGIEGLSPEERTLVTRQTVDSEGRVKEARAVGTTPQTVTTTGGGYLVPQGFQNELMDALKAFGGVRSIARILNTPSGNPIEWPTVDDTANAGEIVPVNTTVTDLAVVYGHKTLVSYKYSSKLISVPIELAQDSAFDIDAHVRGVMATRIGRYQNTTFTTGTGTGEPQGVVVAAYSTATSEAATGVTYNDFVNLEHSVDPAYRVGGNVGFMFADSTLKIAKKLKDADGNPIWRSGLAGGSPNDILGYRYVINQDMAAATTGLKSVLFGDFSHYIVRDVMSTTVLRLVERFAEFGDVGYIAFARADGRGVNAETNNGAIRYLLQA